MCFNPQMSFAFASFAAIGSVAIYWKTKNIAAASGVFFFSLMEFLQAVQYIWIDDCDSYINKFLTILGFLHICCQPFFTHVLTFAGMKDRNQRKQWKFLARVIILGGLCLFARGIFGMLGWFIYEKDPSGFIIGYDPVTGEQLGNQQACGVSSEWLRGSKVCTFSGRHHLGWSMPMSSPSYFIAGSFIHTFTMFGPFFISTKWWDWVMGGILFLTGPVLSYLITDDNMERASIWCFFSICQVTLLLLFAVVFKVSEFDVAKREQQWAEEDAGITSSSGGGMRSTKGLLDATSSSGEEQVWGEDDRDAIDAVV